MDGQVKLNGLNLSEPRKLTPPGQLQNKVEPAQLPLIEEPTAKSTPSSSLASTDKTNISNIANMASSAVAGGIGAAAIASDISTIGESMRAVNIQNKMTDIQDRQYSNNSSYGDSSYGGNSNYGYDADYGATEFVRRRGYGRVEYSSDRRYGRIESGGMNSPETRLAATNLAKGTLQGAKYGVIIGGAVSAVVNAYKVLTGQEKGANAVGKVAADTVTAGVSGAGGALGGGLATLGLATVGIGGLPGMVIGVGIGAVGAVASQLFMTKTGIYDSIQAKVSAMLGK